MTDRRPLVTPGRIAQLADGDRVIVSGIVRTAAGDLTFEDPVTGSKTLAELAAGGGGGSIGGTLGTTDNAITRADGVGGVTAQGSLVTIDDAGAISLPALATVDGRDISEDWLALGSAASSGLVTGGVLSIGAPNTTFSITDGHGYIVDSTTTPTAPTYTKVTWSGKTNIAVTNIATQNITFVHIDSGGNVIQQSTRWTPDQYRDNIILGVVVHVDRVIVDAVNQEQASRIHNAEAAIDIMAGIGFVNASGNIFSANGANLNINKSAGTMLAHGSNWDSSAKNPNIKALPGLTAATFQYRYQDGTNGATGIAIDPNTYDVGGTPTAVSVNKWTVQRIFSFVSNNVKIQPGQAEYSTAADAKAAIGTSSFVTEASIAANGLLRGFLVVKQGATDLSNTAQAQFLTANKFGDVAGGSAPASVSTLQSAYDNSTANPEIQTSTSGGAVQLRRGSAADTDIVLEVQNGAATATFTVSGSGVINSGSISSSGNVSGANLSGTNTGDQTITLTGDVTGSGTGSFAATIANDAVTYAKIQNVTASRLLGRGDSGAGDPQELTVGSGLSIAGTVLSATGGVSYTTISPTSIGSDQNNYSPASWSTADIVRLTSSGVYDITGLDASATNPRKTLQNVNASSFLVLKHESGSSTAANRIACPHNVDVVLPPNGFLTVHYDSTSSRWRPIANNIRPVSLLSAVRRTTGALIASSSYIGFDQETFQDNTQYVTFDGAGTWTFNRACTVRLHATISFFASTSGVGALVIDFRTGGSFTTVIQEQRSSAEQATDSYTTMSIDAPYTFAVNDQLRFYVTNFGGSPNTIANMTTMSITHLSG